MKIAVFMFLQNFKVSAYIQYICCYESIEQENKEVDHSFSPPCVHTNYVNHFTKRTPENYENFRIICYKINLLHPATPSKRNNSTKETSNKTW